MRHGWEIKKLGEVCEIVGGSTPKTKEPTYWNGEYYWATPADLNGSKYISSTMRTITDAGIKSAHLQLLPIGTVLLSSRAPIGKVAITTVPMYCNQGFKNLICGNTLNNGYAYWFLSYNTDYLNSIGTGATFKEISKTVVEQIPITIPPLSEQERIVAELDLLSDVIAKKREQLKQLDTLAQSIFYDMFGDPITNEKGWETKKFEDCYRLTSGQGLSAKSILSGEYPVYGGNGIIGYHCIYNLDGENIIIGRVGALCGNVRYVIGKVFITDNAFILTKKIKNVNIFLLYLLRLHNLRKYAREAMQPVISNSGLKNILIIIPPLALQQQFASMIESIEKQKELIKQSLSEVQQLFDSRMDYYFG